MPIRHLWISLMSLQNSLKVMDVNRIHILEHRPYVILFLLRNPMLYSLLLI